MTLLAIIWLVGFLVLLVSALTMNASAFDPLDRWPAACVFLFALWPLWLVLAAVAGAANLLVDGLRDRR